MEFAQLAQAQYQYDIARLPERVSQLEDEIKKIKKEN